jgi:lipid II:glycine glycyltransferase (peptidoglycan interpeptide bridge formation enzyme)
MPDDLRSQIGELEADPWHRIMSDFDDARLDQTRAYAAAKWPTARLETMLLERQSEVVAAAQVVIFRVPGLGPRLAYVKLGPLWRRRGRPEEPEILRAILRELRAEFAGRRGLLLRIYPAAYKDRDDGVARLLEQEGFARPTAGFEAASSPRFVLDLTPDLERLRAGLKRKWRYNLSRTEPHAFEFAEHGDAAAVAFFVDLYQRMLERKRFYDGSAIASFPTFHAALPADFRPSVIECRVGEETLAMAVVDSIGDTGVYLYGASSERGRELGAGYALHWWIVRWLRDRGARRYDLGEGITNPGLRQFKTGLVGRTGFIAPLLGNFDACDNTASLWIGRLATGLQDAQQRLRERIGDRS